MMKIVRLCIVLLCAVAITISLNAQTEHQKQNLIILSEELRLQSEREKEEAIRKAVELGLPVRQELPDGSVIELMHFKDGLPMYYTTFNAEGASVINSNKVYPGGSAGLILTGSGQTLGIWDAGGVLLTHQEFGARVTQQDSPLETHWHATHVAGTMMAGGAVAGAKGMSYQANLDAWDWNSDASEMSAAAANGLRVSQHSYGFVTGWAYGGWSGNAGWHWFGNPSISETEDYGFGFYGNSTQTWDQIAYNAPNYVIVKSAGNDRGQGPAPGTEHYVFVNNSWQLSTTVRDLDGGADGFDCIPWRGNAKNIITVGAVTAAGAMSNFSSWGPTDDGRVKPDIVAKGVLVYSPTGPGNDEYGYANGTSMSGPMISGSVGLLLHHQENLHPGTPLLSSTIKGLIIHSADEDISSSPGPDYRFGWGLMDTEAAALIMSADETNGGIHIHELTINNGETLTIPVKATGTEPLRSSIVWNDVPGTPPTPSLNPGNLMLVNDLDMRIVDAQNNYFYPYILDPENPSLAATTGDNFRDNVEVIHILAPIADAMYDIVISHKGSLSGGSQDFSLIITGNQSYSSVPNELVLENITVGTGQSECFDAVETITIAGNGSFFVVESNASAVLLAGESITFKHGTLIEYQGYLSASITENHEYCNQEASLLVVEDISFENGSLEQTLTVSGREINIFPNPGTGLFTLELPAINEHTNVYMEIYSMTGKRITQSVLPAQSQHIFDLTGHPAGLYLVRVIKGNEIKTLRVLKH